ncbi:MAG TPA: tetratricopeptide repeat protein [Candidatus Dormibacteraeota bacterium]|nr:tetratricopeptide repeat protein [Candidatus Dormibacteraeota bacterium]
MDASTSENSFRRGLRAVDRGAHLEALAYFEAAVQLARRLGAEAVPMKYLSYYGWCLAICSDRLDEAREFCEAAVRSEFYNPDAYWNLGRVYLKTGDRSLAFDTIVRGLQLNPRHSGLVGVLRRLGIRRKPVLPLFDRSHPVNRLLGRLRRSLSRVAPSSRERVQATGR